MSLLVRLNVALGIVFLCAAFIAGYACWAILEANARREVLAEAGLMMDSAVAIRAYTAAEVLPLLEPQMRESFPPQSVPFYAATQNFLKLRERHPDFTYKEATLNPTNPQPTGFPVPILQQPGTDGPARGIGYMASGAIQVYNGTNTPILTT